MSDLEVALTSLLVVLALGIAGGYFTLALFVVPKIRLEGVTEQFGRSFGLLARAFFVGCGMTHLHIAAHAFDEYAGTHELVFHALQIIGVWGFVLIALVHIDVSVSTKRRRTP